MQKARRRLFVADTRRHPGIILTPVLCCLCKDHESHVTPTDRGTASQIYNVRNHQRHAHLDMLIGVGLVLLPHSFRSLVISWVTPTPVMFSFICWCLVFLGRPRRLVPGIASSTTLRLRVTLFASLLWTCPNQRRRPLRITSSIGDRCN